MSKLRRPVVVFLLVAAGCGGDGPTGTVTVASISIAPSSATLEHPGATVQLTATVHGSDGSTMSNIPTWASTDAQVATVSSSGLVTGVGAGTAIITASTGGRDGSANITVHDQSAACETPDTVSLAPGGSALYDRSACIMLPSGASGDHYRVAVYRPTSAEDSTDVSTVNLRITGVGVTSSPAAPVPARVPAPSSAFGGLGTEALERSLRMADATRRAHLAMRAQDAQIWESAGVGARLPSRPAASVQRADSPSKMQLDPRFSNTCSAGPVETVTAILIDENDDLVIYQDSTQHAVVPVTDIQASSMLAYYTLYGKQTVTSYFGEPSDIDGNGKLVIFVTPEVPATLAALTWSGDFYSREVCAGSNEMEIVYFNNSVIQDMSHADNPGFQALPTLAHEAKHVVELYHRIAASDGVGSVQFQPLWIQEGTAEIAAEMSSRLAWADAGGPAVGSPVVWDDILAAGITPENYGVIIVMARTVWYLSSQPNGLVASPQGARQELDAYASGWTFFRWVGDAYGNAATPLADAPMFKEQTDSLTAPGLAGLTAITGSTYERLLEEFFTAVMLHGTGAPEPARAHSTYDYISATKVLATMPAGFYPWPVTERSTEPGTSTPASFTTATYSGPIGSSGVRIHDFMSNGTGTGAQIEITAKAPAKMLVVRIR